jgi:hypothetical protein
MLPKVRAERPNVPVIMLTAYGDDPGSHWITGLRTWLV